MNYCLNCGTEVKNKYCNSKCRNAHNPTVYIPTEDSIKKQKETVLNKWKAFTVECCKCGNSIEIKEYNVDKPKKDKYYCSRSCANIRFFTSETKQKIKIKNKGQVPWNKEKEEEKIYKMCPVCKEEFRVRQSESKKIYCTKKCYLEDNKCEFRKNGLGGIRKGSGRGKSGWYKGFWSDSSWELAWIIFNIDHDIVFERNKSGFVYIFNNKQYKFYPDFILNDKYYEIKGYMDEKNLSKLEQFKEKLIILNKKEIEPYLKYVIEKYGKNYIELYEGNPHKIKNNKCLICGKECKNLYCSRFCSGIAVSKK